MIEIFIVYDVNSKLFYKGKCKWTNDPSSAKAYTNIDHAKDGARAGGGYSANLQIMKFEALCVSKENFSW